MDARRDRFVSLGGSGYVLGLLLARSHVYEPQNCGYRVRVCWHRPSASRIRRAGFSGDGATATPRIEPAGSSRGVATT
jgi:hypothetical protein